MQSSGFGCVVDDVPERCVSLVKSVLLLGLRGHSPLGEQLGWLKPIARGIASGNAVPANVCGSSVTKSGGRNVGPLGHPARFDIVPHVQPVGLHEDLVVTRRAGVELSQGPNGALAFLGMHLNNPALHPFVVGLATQHPRMCPLVLVALVAVVVADDA